MTGDERLAKVAEVLVDALCDSPVWAERHIGELEYHIADGIAQALKPLLDEFRAEAWEEAHDKFCPLANFCSTHMKPGDRHLLSRAALGAAEPDAGE